MVVFKKSWPGDGGVLSAAVELKQLKLFVSFSRFPFFFSAFLFCRTPPVCGVLPAAAGPRDLRHRHGDSGPDAHRHLLWQHHRIVRPPVLQTHVERMHAVGYPAFTVRVCVRSNDAGPGFELRVELYSCCSEEDYSAGSTPRKLASKLSSSLGRSAGKKLRAAMEPGPCSPVNNGGAAPLLLPVPSVA